MQQHDKLFSKKGGVNTDDITHSLKAHSSIPNLFSNVPATAALVSPRLAWVSGREPRGGSGLAGGRRSAEYDGGEKKLGDFEGRSCRYVLLSTSCTSGKPKPRFGSVLQRAQRSHPAPPRSQPKLPGTLGAAGARTRAAGKPPPSTSYLRNRGHQNARSLRLWGRVLAKQLSPGAFSPKPNISILDNFVSCEMELFPRGRFSPRAEPFSALTINTSSGHSSVAW